MHADLKREPRTKPEVPGEGVESVTAQVWVKPPKEKRMGGRKENNKKPLPLPSALKAANGNDGNKGDHHVSRSSGVADDVVVKVLKVPAGKPQRRSSSDAGMVATDPGLRILQRTLVFSPKPLYYVRTVHIPDALCSGHTYLPVLGEQTQPGDWHAGTPDHSHWEKGDGQSCSTTPAEAREV